MACTYSSYKMTVAVILYDLQKAPEGRYRASGAFSHITDIYKCLSTSRSFNSTSFRRASAVPLMPRTELSKDI